MNEELLFVNVKLAAAECGLAEEDADFDHENDVTISGYSEAILRFVAEKGNQGQLLHVENIDRVFELAPLVNGDRQRRKEEVKAKSRLVIPMAVTGPKWKTIKVNFQTASSDISARFSFDFVQTRCSSPPPSATCTPSARP